MGANRLAILLFAALVAAAVAFEAPAQEKRAPQAGLQVLVRPLEARQGEELRRLRKQLAVAAAGVRFPAFDAYLWTTRLPETQVRKILEEYRPRIASEILVNSPSVVAWPVKPAQLTEGARANYARIDKTRDYAARRGLIRLMGAEFSGPLLRHGLPGMDGLPAGASLRWQLFDDVSFHSTRIALKSNSRGSFAWMAELRDLPGARRDAKEAAVRAGKYQEGFAAATYRNGHLHARFEHGGSVYQLVPLGDQFHLVLKLDVAKIPEREESHVAHAPVAMQSDRPAPGDCGGGEGDRPVSGDAGIGEGDRPVSGDAGIGEGDRPVSGDAGIGEGDRPVSGDAGIGEGDNPISGDAGIGEGDAFGAYCPRSCSADAPARGQACDEGPRTCANIRLGVAFSQEAFAQLPSITAKGMGSPLAPTPMNARHYAQYLVDLTHASFVRSGVHTRVHLGEVDIVPDLEREHADPSALIAALTYVPNAALGQTLASLPVPPSALVLRQWRDKTAADVAMVLTTKGAVPGVGEVAGWSPSKKRVRDPASAYSVVIARYADANLSFQHELGHHLGAYHDPASGTGAPPFAYAQGAVDPTCEWRTIMAYASKCPSNPPPRLAMWSSCNLFYRGTPVGDADQNNVRIINRLSGWIAGFR